MIYQHVKPADPRASVPDPVRGGVLPPDGYDVLYTSAWIALAKRGDVIVSDPVGPVPGPPQPPSPPVLSSDAVGLRRGGVMIDGTVDDLAAWFIANALTPATTQALLTAFRAQLPPLPAADADIPAAGGWFANGNGFVFIPAR